MSQTLSSQWVSISQSYHCSLFKVSSQGNRGFQEAHTQWWSFCSTPANTMGQSKPPSTTEKEHGFCIVIPVPTSITSHKQAKPSALWGFVPLSSSHHAWNGEETNSQLVQRWCGSLLGRLPGKRNKQNYTSFVAPPLMSTSSALEQMEKQNSKDL